MPCFPNVRRRLHDAIPCWNFWRTGSTTSCVSRAVQRRATAPAKQTRTNRGCSRPFPRVIGARAQARDDDATGTIHAPEDPR